MILTPGEETLRSYLAVLLARGVLDLMLTVRRMAATVPC
jgi:hypothetical protein